MTETRKSEQPTRVEAEPEATRPDPVGLRRRRQGGRGPLVAIAAAVVVVVIGAAAAILALSGDGGNDVVTPPPTTTVAVEGLQPGPVTSFEDFAGRTYLTQAPRVPLYVHFLEDGTMNVSVNPDLVVDRPSDVYTTRFEGTQAFITTTDADCPQPDQGGTYEIQLLEDGNLQFVAIDEDACALRSSFLQRGFEPVP